MSNSLTSSHRDGSRSSGSVLAEDYAAVRRRTEALAEPLPVEDQVVQTMPTVSPTKWHLAHTTWFFETFVAMGFVDAYRPFCEEFQTLFNSYYRSAGARFERARRGTIGRPGVERILEYRQYVDEAMQRLLDGDTGDDGWRRLVEVGLNHEQQHQELILTDAKHVLGSNPLRPVYRRECATLPGDADTSVPPLEWIDIPGGVEEIGYDGAGFCFDNEQPRHRVMLDGFRIASRPVTCGEYAEFIDDGGYGEFRWWLAEGFDGVESEGWTEPLYWEKRDGDWWVMTLGGMRPIDPAEPVCHLSYYEADAYARWSGARLPTEAEWEVASRFDDIAGNFADSGRFHPRSTRRFSQDEAGFFGDVWEWTSSGYEPYPGFESWEDELGEYNGKFMCNQYVLRGGSCATAKSHIRRSYRNFFHPHARWQFSGIRLAK